MASRCLHLRYVLFLFQKPSREKRKGHAGITDDSRVLRVAVA